MRWSSAAARGLQHPTTGMITNINDNVREVNESTGPATAAAVFAPEVFFGIDAADARNVVTRIVPNDGVKPAEGMTKATLVKRVAEHLNAGFRVHCVYEAGPTGFVLARELIALGAKNLAACAHCALDYIVLITATSALGVMRAPARSMTSVIVWL